MQDGHTRKINRSELKGQIFLKRFRVTLVVVQGPESGTEHVLDRDQVTLGRGPDADICFDDSAMSKQHAALEITPEGYRVRDMGSTNGTSVNGSQVVAADLKHGDRIGLGDHTLQYLAERSERVATYDLSEEM
ncbi:MAG: FHA domain-containing protein [Deltaproteobacteria bacterium]|nr:FHA domain-containing protein [Deltaproteobacteria bacterium]MBW2421085.1 FHA domain-containing protein [Deltaproteobacteria bacterium]